VRLVLEQSEINKAVGIACFNLEEDQRGDDEHDGQRDDQGVEPPERGALSDDDVHGQHGDDKSGEAVPVEATLLRGLDLALRSAPYQQETDDRDQDREPEDPPPSE